MVEFAPIIPLYLSLYWYIKSLPVRSASTVSQPVSDDICGGVTTGPGAGVAGPGIGVPGLGSGSQHNTSDSDSESEYKQESEDDQDSWGRDIPTTITLHERKSLDDDNPKKRKGSPRSRFTEQEKQALIQGVQRFGEGSWSKIKAGSNGALSSRSPGQIKDLYRTMRKTNHAKASSPLFGAYK